MHPVENKILNYLLDKYENSKLSRGENQRAIHIAFPFNKKTMPKYFDESSLEIETIHAAAEQMERKGLVAIAWKNQKPGYIIEKLVLCEDHVEEAYERLGRKPKREAEARTKQILEQLEKNLEIAKESQIPICQDTGMAVVFLEIGQDVHLEGGALEDAVNEGVRQGYVEGYLRKSVVGDPLIRENTKDNTPAVLHTRIVDGDQVKIKVAPKGFGSENMSRVFMLKPAEGIEGVKDAVLTAVKEAGPNACPPMVVGVGIGGTFEKCALMAKEALTRKVGSHSEIEYVKELEEELLTKINKK